MLHDLTTSAQSFNVTTAFRSYAMLTTDPTTVVNILAAHAEGVTDPTEGVLIAQLTAQSQRAQVTDSSTYVYYAVTQGSAPTYVWMDAI